MGIMQECIRVEKLSKCYHKKEIISSISFQVGQGQLFAFLGPNGAGKSTTMSILSTLLSKTGGDIYIDGLNMDTKRDEIKRKIGIVFQNDLLDPELTVYQNLFYRGGLYSKTKQELTQRISSIADLLSLRDILAQNYGCCSGGQKRLAQIARALLPSPRLLILDEPTAGLDPVTRQMVWNVLIRLREVFHITIFFTTHYMDEASKADCICILNHGKILLNDGLRQIQERYPGHTKEESLDRLYFNLLKGDSL